MAEPKQLGEFLQDAGIVTQEQINVALSVQKVQQGFLGEILEDLDFVTPLQTAQAIAVQQSLDFVDIEDIIIDPKVLQLVAKEIAFSKKILPLFIENSELVVAAFDIKDIATKDYLTKAANMPIKYVVCDKNKLASMIELHYYQLEHPIEARIESMLCSELDCEDVDVIRLLDLVINNAIKDRATDIHITPDKSVVHIFFRIDGVLKHYYAFGKRLHAKIVARIKILSQLDIAEQRLPQDGGLSHQFLDQDYDLRISTLPTNQGENVVIRILSQSASLLDLASLGIDSEQIQMLKSYFSKPYGMVLIAGPTGSGKTTTLYSALREINALAKNVLTVEDPIEYKFSFIKQTQINLKAGYDFSKAIRHFMRQDPDVMLVGEIRDHETAELAVRASITGHLVLSTLHTNSAVGTIPRLLDMGVSQDLIATSLLAVVAQRLVRKLCLHCREAVDINSEVLGVDTHETMSIYKAKEGGCKLCRHTGYHGRIAIIEILPIDASLKKMISSGLSTYEVLSHTENTGMKTMRMSGLKRVIEGVTSLEELDRVTL